MANNGAEVIDSLLVSLGVDLDDKGFKKATDQISSLKSGLLQLGAAAGVSVGFDTFSRGVANKVNELNRLSRITKFTAKEIEGLNHALRSVGVFDDSAGGSIAQRIEEIQRAVRDGTINMKAYFAGSNFNPSQFANLEGMDAVKYLVDAYSKLDHLKQSQVREGLSTGANDPLTRLMEIGPEKFNTVMQYFEGNYRGVSDSLSENAERFNDELAKLKLNFEDLSYSISGPLLKSLNELLETSNKLYSENRTWIDSVMSGEWYNELMKPTEEYGEKFRGWLKGLFSGKDAPIAKNNEVVGGTLSGYTSGYLNNTMSIYPSAFAAATAGGALRGDVPQLAQSVKATSTDSNSNLFADLESKHDLPSGLLNATYQKESGGGKYLYSKAGALGPFQFMPDTAKDMGLRGDDVFDLEKSADAAARYYKILLKRYNGDVARAAAAYNHGLGNIDKKGLSNLPAETRDYIPSILGGLDNPDYLADYNFRKNQAPLSSVSNRSGGGRVINNNQHFVINAASASAEEVSDIVFGKISDQTAQANSQFTTDKF